MVDWPIILWGYNVTYQGWYVTTYNYNNTYCNRNDVHLHIGYFIINSCTTVTSVNIFFLEWCPSTSWLKYHFRNEMKWNEWKAGVLSWEQSRWWFGGYRTTKPTNFLSIKFSEMVPSWDLTVSHSLISSMFWYLPLPECCWVLSINRINRIWSVVQFQIFIFFESLSYIKNYPPKTSDFF